MRIVIALVFLFLVYGVGAQQPTSGGLDSLTLPIQAGKDSVPKERLGGNGFLRRGYPNPTKAMVLSFVLPGAGQAYNKKWWKIPIVYGVLGGLTVWEIYNLGYYRDFRDNYKALVDGDMATNPTESPYIYMDSRTLKFYRDDWRKKLERSSLFLGLGYFLTATDAFVDAHLASFDVNDDLSLKFGPKMEAYPGTGVSLGVGLRLQIGRPSETKP